MRPVQSLVHSRARVRQRFALMPLEGFPFSRLPLWPDAQVRVLASPAIGAKFVQYEVQLPPGKFVGFSNERTETFYYVLSGHGKFGPVELSPGAFGLIAPGDSPCLGPASSENLRFLVLQKTYEAVEQVKAYRSFHGHESNVKKKTWAGDSDALLQTLIPDDPSYDLAMNIFMFSPGHGLPIVETHVMEHGLYFLEGKGLYYLDDAWMEVEKDDFIWMAPYCPQSFYATGPTPSRYLYYKNVNREISL